MKNITFIVVLFFSLYSCNEGKKTKNTAVDEKTTSSTVIDTAFYADRGLEYALNAQAILGKNLMQAMQKDGTIGALSFCNEKAYPLSDSMAVVQNVKLKRVSDKPRNPVNQATAEELNHIELYKNSIANQKTPEPLVTRSADEVQVYYPILTNGMCLQCHGTSKNIEPNTLKKLTLLYPTDKALEYDLNEVRGMWRVTFDTK